MAEEVGAQIKRALSKEVALSPAATIKQSLVGIRNTIASVMPQHQRVDRLLVQFDVAVRSNPNLQMCSPDSFRQAVLQAATLGLELVAGQGFLVPYKTTAQFIPGWQGMVDLVSRSGRATVWTGAVYAGDQFEWGYGSRPFIDHKPCGEDDPKKLIFVYACGKVNGQETPVIEVWPISKVWKHRDRGNKQGPKHYSFKHPEMYARKLPLLQVMKYMPKSIELQNALAVANAEERGGMGVTLEMAGNEALLVDVEGYDNDRGEDEDGNALPEQAPPPPPLPAEQATPAPAPTTKPARPPKPEVPPAPDMVLE